MGNACIDNKIHVQYFSRDVQKILKESFQEDYFNGETVDSLFRGFIDYYFNGAGFDHVHDVIDTRTGRVVKLGDIPEKMNDPVNGIEPRVRRNLKESIFGILDPFDYNYVPSKAFSLSYRYKDMLHYMAEFIQPEPAPKSESKKNGLWKAFLGHDGEGEEYEY